ncbi:MAG: LysM peptidoglycan-binding domain-containing protein, partial [Deltaproteobacteria bacterium]|nr:LysM peptidoglycan-binding domain-containing protein [Deltaproteobacteria bacterium]
MIFLPLLPAPLSAREDSASLVLQKTSGGGKSRVHVVKKGEWIHSILRSQFGEEPIPYALIRQLNPGIRNLNRIHPGQRIVLPVPGSSESSESISDIGRENSSPPVIYRILEGDSISRIILSEMNVNPAEALPAYRLIRKLNSEIPDLNRLPAGQTLRLPPAPARSTVPPAAPLETAARPTEKSDAETAAIADSLLGIIRPVIGRMRGAVTVTGSYFIPLQETTQITIDCAQIPVVELDDGTTVLLDYGDRLSENLKRLIRQSWKNYAFLTAEEFRDGLGGLLGIIRH